MPCKEEGLALVNHLIHCQPHSPLSLCTFSHYPSKILPQLELLDLKWLLMKCRSINLMSYTSLFLVFRRHTSQLMEVRGLVCEGWDQTQCPRPPSPPPGKPLLHRGVIQPHLSYTSLVSIRYRYFINILKCVTLSMSVLGLYMLSYLDKGY